MDKRQTHLIFPQVVARRLAHFLVFIIIEDVIFDLEAEAEQTGIFHERGDLLGSCLYTLRSHLHAFHEERSRLLAYHVEIAAFIYGAVSRI